MQIERLSVLVIDDESLILDTLGEYLSERGFEVFLAEGGRKGLEMFFRKNPTLVLVDLRMPEVDGLEVIKTITRKSPTTPVIVVSGTGVIQDAIDALRLGAWDFVTKPLSNFAVLDHALNKALERRRLIRENQQYQEHLEEQVRIRTSDLEREISKRKLIERRLRESEQKFRELSIKDGLTGLYNSRHFFNQIDVELERCHRYGHTLSLIFMDIDDFKQYNDTFGHPMGDHVLKNLAQVILKVVRKNDTAFRYGGEEFVILLPETENPEAVQVAERIRRSFARMVQCRDSMSRPVHKTISAGVAEHRPGETATRLIERADRYLYAAKALGKNTIVRDDIFRQLAESVDEK
ncbi:GGDEF domain-containing response regulator [Desulfoplanes formicivorans]|uniref:diguanylate cyclase n=1 Tax=Desulfoplanes formicivorans TaxID=1592317 RepID=A0A194AHF2_9BACT|nr:diguanylate cyclase [Desulfoplanes formicivorans]GAU08189.1 diguanylate cyclase [Desulfoplanes formicivorans]